MDKCIDWSAVAEDYHGIMIPNYRKSMEHAFRRWYDTWDCDSGCIWNKLAIDRLVLIREPMMEKVV